METKFCAKCDERKDLTEFWRRQASADGLHYWCKDCNRAYGSRWARDNRKYRTEYQLRRQHENREAYNAYCRNTEPSERRRPMCDICQGTGIHLVDIGTATIPDYIEVRCKCDPDPTDADYDDSHVMGTCWDDFQPRHIARLFEPEYTLPSRLLG